MSVVYLLFIVHVFMSKINDDDDDEDDDDDDCGGGGGGGDDVLVSISGSTSIIWYSQFSATVSIK